MIESDPPLSDAGRDRRDAILRLALRATTRRRRRRYMVRGASAGGALALVAALALHWSGGIDGQPSRSNPDQLVAVPERPPLVPSPPPSLPRAGIVPAVARIETDPAITRRLSISDDELLASLAQAGERAGLIEVDGRTVLVRQVALNPASAP